MKKLRLTAALFVASYSIFWPLLIPQPVFADVASNVSVVCAKPTGEQETFNIGWDNSIAFFKGKGEIPRLFCEGGYALGGYTVYVSDNLTNNSLRYYNGIEPSPTPQPEPSTSPSPQPEQTASPSPSPTQTPQSEQPSPSPTPSTSTSPEPSPSQTPTPEPSQPSISTPTPTPQSSDGSTVTATPTPESSPSSEPSPTQSPSAEPTPSVSAASPTPTNPEPTPTPTPVESTPSLPSFVSGIINENGILELIAPIGKVFDAVLFASYGTPNDYVVGQCHAESSVQKVAEAFLGKKISSILASNGVFGDPCGGTYKKLAVKLSYTDEPTPVPSPTPLPTPTPTPMPTPTPSPQPEPTPQPQPEPQPQPTPQPVPSPEPTPIPVPIPVEPAPTPQPTPSPTETQNPGTTPTDTPKDDTPSDTPNDSENPQDTPESSDNPSTDTGSSTDQDTGTEQNPTEEPSQPTDPAPVDGNGSTEGEPPSEESEEQPSDNQEQQNQSQESQTTPIVEPSKPEPTPETVISNALADGKLTAEEKIAVVAVLISDLKPGEAVSSEAIKEAGLEYKDLPPETPVDVRTDENGNEVVITAEVASSLELLADPGALLDAVFTDPGAALAALGNIGADMSPQEREEAQKMVVATVIAAGAAMNAVAAAGGVTRKG